MLANLGPNDEGGNIEVLFNDKHINYKKKNLFLLNDLALKEPIQKLEERTTKNKEQVLNLIINADDISSMSSIESENELWESIENRAINKINVARNQYRDSDSVSAMSDAIKNKMRRKTTVDEREENPAAESITSDNRQLVEKFEKKMEKLKENHRLEVMTISNSLQAKAKEMVSTKLEEIKIKFESDTRILMAQLVDLKSQLTDKDKQIAALKEIIKTQESTLKGVKTGIDRSVMGEDRSDHSIGFQDDHANEIFNLKQLIDQYQSEVNAMRSLCNTYKKDENNAKKELREMQVKFQESEIKHQIQLEEVSNNFEMKVQGLMSEIAVGKRELTRFKNNYELEIKILKALAQKYKEKENLPPLENSRIHGKTGNVNKSFSHDRSKANLKDERRNSLKKDKRENSVATSDNMKSDFLNSGIPSRPESSDEGSRVLVNQLGKGRKLKKGDYDDGHSTFYSRDRGSLVTPDSTKYGSFVTRPGTSLLDRSKMSNTFTEQSEQL